MIYNQKTINILNNVFKKYPERFKDACDSLNENQQRSKHWLVEKLNEYKDDWSGKNLKTGINVSVLTSWYGMMAYILINDFKLNGAIVLRKKFEIHWIEKLKRGITLDSIPQVPF